MELDFEPECVRPIVLHGLKVCALDAILLLAPLSITKILGHYVKREGIYVSVQLLSHVRLSATP